MSDSITVRVDGLAQLSRNLRDIPHQFSTRIMRDALHAGGDVIKTAAEGTAPVKNGALKGDIVVKVYVDPQLKNNYALVGPGYNRAALAKNEKSSDSPGVYGKFVEEGHGPPGSAAEKRKAQHKGLKLEFGDRDTPPHPWLRPAFELSKTGALAAFVTVVKSGLLAVARLYQNGRVK